MCSKILLANTTGKDTGPSTGATSRLSGVHPLQACFRDNVLAPLGDRLNGRIAPKVFQSAIDMPWFGSACAKALVRRSEVEAVLIVPGAAGLRKLFDLPWLPFYLIAVYMFHPGLGGIAFAGALVMTTVTMASELMAQRLTLATNRAFVARNRTVISNARSAELLMAMGFASDAARWLVTYENRPDGDYTTIHGSVDGELKAEIRLSFKGTHDLRDLNLNL